MAKGWGRSAAALALAGLGGCGTTHVTDTSRTATEQLLISNSIDQAVSEVDVSSLAGRPVFFEDKYLDGVVDKGYLISSLRQHLLANGCHLVEDRAKATYVVEARAGAVGTDRSEVLYGVPQLNVPSVVPGQPSGSIPEIPLAKKTNRRGVAKVAVFCYNRQTGQPVWQSGVVQKVSTARDRWVLGAGPFVKGTLYADNADADTFKIPFLTDDADKPSEPPSHLIPVTHQVAWTAPAPPAATEPGMLPSLPPVAGPITDNQVQPVGGPAPQP
jgi:hypothetical protein